MDQDRQNTKTSTHPFPQPSIFSIRPDVLYAFSFLYLVARSLHGLAVSLTMRPKYKGNACILGSATWGSVPRGAQKSTQKKNHAAIARTFRSDTRLY